MVRAEVGTLCVWSGRSWEQEGSSALLLWAVRGSGWGWGGAWWETVVCEWRGWGGGLRCFSSASFGGPVALVRSRVISVALVGLV